MAAVEGPLSGKEWRGRKMGAKEELEWRSLCVWGKVGKWDLEKRKGGGEGGLVRMRGLMEREKVLIEESGTTEVG